MKFELNSKHENVIRMVALQNDNLFPNRTIIQKAFEIKKLGIAKEQNMFLYEILADIYDIIKT